MSKPFNEKRLRYKLKKQHWNKKKIDKYIKQLKKLIKKGVKNE